MLTWPENWIPVNGKILKSEHILTKSLLILSAYNTNQKTSKCKKKKVNNVFVYYYYYFRLIYGIICDPPFEEWSSCLALTQLSSAPWLTFTPLSSLCKYTFSKNSLITVLWPMNKESTMCTRTHTQEYYFPLMKEEILSLTTTWMNLEDILNYRSQTQKDKYCMNSLTWGL